MNIWCLGEASLIQIQRKALKELYDMIMRTVSIICEKTWRLRLQKENRVSLMALPRQVLEYTSRHVRIQGNWTRWPPQVPYNKHFCSLMILWVQEMIGSPGHIWMLLYISLWKVPLYSMRNCKYEKAVAFSHLSLINLFICDITSEFNGNSVVWEVPF